MNDTGNKRQRDEPDLGQESVWDYPRPPRVESSAKHVQVVFDGIVVADTRRAQRILETSHPPVYYIPSEDVRVDCLRPSSRHSWCEWKGEARYFSVATANQTAVDAAWTYLEPQPSFEAIRGHLAFYALPLQALKQPCLFDPISRLGACGDWCWEPRVEGAFLSGVAAAENVLRSVALAP